MLTAERLREVLDYDPSTGHLVRRVRMANHLAGTIAGCLCKSSGYVKANIDGRMYQAHRLAWLWVYGEWPQHGLDHINGIRNDNRIANLRDAPARVNNENQRGPKIQNRSGLLGVHWHARGKKWCAMIGINGKSKYLGLFSCPNAAHEAYLEAKRRLHEGCTI